MTESTVIGLSVLDTYKVRWSRETVVRDLVQNFYDAVGDFGQVVVEVEPKARTVQVSGPSEFALDYLRYLGATTKAAPATRAAGSFGEGFKICALVLLRDFGVELEAGSGDWEIRPFFRPAKFGRELCYEVRRGGDPRPGSYVRLRGADRRLLDGFRSSARASTWPRTRGAATSSTGASTAA